MGSELVRQLDLLLWGKVYVQESKKAIDALLTWWSANPEPKQEQHSSIGEWLDALAAWQERRDVVHRIFQGEALAKADRAAQRGTSVDWEVLRRHIWERDKGICQVCGKRTVPEDYECGHIIDRFVGGSDRPTNLVVMCTGCNQAKPFHETREEYNEWMAARQQGGEEE